VGSKRELYLGLVSKYTSELLGYNTTKIFHQEFVLTALEMEALAAIFESSAISAYHRVSQCQTR